MKRAVLFCFLIAPLLHADGGAVVFSRTSQHLVITLFASPSPIEAGREDFSVLVQKEGTLTPVLDADVVLHLGMNNEEESALKATHGAATNKLLYATAADLPMPGRWQVVIACGGAQVRGEFDVLPAEPSSVHYWPYIALLPLAIVLFGANQLLKRRRSS